MQEPPNAFDVERPLSSAQLLRTRFGAFFAANLLGSTALWFLDVAAAILIYQETRSALWVSLVAVFGFGASIASSPFGGIIADRFDRRRALAVAFGAASLAALIVAVIPGGSGDVRLLLDIYGYAAPDHPMTQVLREGIDSITTAPKRRGGARARR